uniref:FCH domain-containing protein n=1 Tax=Daphnia galeata TaxID=27404 RepID=A0A8J2RR66_9CRUS|nr:unnamed protein product [Daphnia galeata]
MNAKTNQQQVQQQQQFGSSVEVLVDTAADHHQPLFDYHRAHPLTDEPTLVRLDPYQQQQIYPPPPAPNNHHHPAQHHPSVYLAPSSSISCNIQQQQHRSSAFSSSNGSPSSVQQQHGSTQRLDIRNLLLAPPAAVRNVRDGRGSVSAPATPVDDNSNSSSAGGLVIAASTVVTAAVPLNFNISSSSGSSTTTNCGSAAAASSASGNKNNSALGKFMMKKVNSYSSGVTMTGSAPSDCVLRDLIHPAHADALKAHSALAMKLLKTVSDFTQQLATIEEQHGEQLQQLVETFRIRNAELRKERPNGNYGLFQVWETLLQEVEVDSAVVADIANCLNRQVSRPMIDGTFHRKLEARKIFQHREQLENALEKASQQLDKSYQLYDEAYQQHLAAPNTLTLAAYVELHNNYVQDVHAANAMADQFHNVILPQLIQELESVYVDLSKIMTNTIQQGCEAMSERAEGSSSKRYNALANQCRTVNAGSDLATFVRSVAGGSGGGGGGSSVLTIPSSFNKFTFIPPRNPPPGSVSCSQHDIQDASLVLKDELVFDRLAGFSLRTKYESLKKDTAEVETHVRQLNECMESLTRLQQRSLESNSYNKASELQEEICAKKLEWRMAQLHLAAVKAQRDLYGSKAEMVMAEVAAASGGSHQSLQQLNSNRGSKFNLMASGSSGSGGPGMKTKWMKAFRTLTNSSSSQNVSASGSTSSTTGSSPPLGNSITPDQ